MASKDVLPLYRRLLKTKAALLAVSFTLIGVLLIMLNAWLATLSLGDWSWLHHLPLDEVGGPLLGAGLVSTILDYSYRRDQEDVAIQRTQDNMLLSVLMEDYINFIDDLSQNANIMDKSFYVVIPYYPAGEGTILDQSKGFFTKLFAPKNTNTVTKISKETYERAREEIRNRADTILNGLMQIGVRAVQLKTKELGTLYYNMYNPDTAVREPLGDFNNVTSTFVRKGEGAVPTSTAYHKGDF